MPRRERMYLPGYTYHVVQRGNNRQPCFAAPADYVLYEQFLQEALLRYGVLLHAYALMGNHVHLLMSPSCIEGISRVMALLGNRYVQSINKRYARTGTLWEGRHRACVIESERYLLNCYRYIDLNPLTAHLVSKPENYLWCSYRCNALGASSDLITPHTQFLALGATTAASCSAYRDLCESILTATEREEIRYATLAGVPLGFESGFCQDAVG